MYNHTNVSSFRNDHPRKSIFEPQCKHLKASAANVHIAQLVSDEKYEKLKSDYDRLENNSRNIRRSINEFEQSKSEQRQL